MAKNDGGAAFPRPASIDESSGTLPDGNVMVPEQRGMSLRDYFAASIATSLPAIWGAMSREEKMLYSECSDIDIIFARDFPNFVALLSYRIADAMLASRK